MESCLIQRSTLPNLFSYRKCIVELNAKVSDGTFDHCVAEQKLHGVSRQAELDRLMVVLDFQADLNCLPATGLAATRARAAPSWRNLVLVDSLYGRNCSYQTEPNMGVGRGILLWILGVPIPIIILLALFWHN
jgi:hypothetical protein